jgi:hypothetical protein
MKNMEAENKMGRGIEREGENQKLIASKPGNQDVKRAVLSKPSRKSRLCTRRVSPWKPPPY